MAPGIIVVFARDQLSLCLAVMPLVIVFIWDAPIIVFIGDAPVASDCSRRMTIRQPRHWGGYVICCRQVSPPGQSWFAKGRHHVMSDSSSKDERLCIP
ncbi:hypothetical protein CRG98_040543 [Punica granatum]|uniref:Uncharacterized protein n=1 Tax=Punica granatum TaxID=22663 RepID=A0A2I0I6L0_PUNGR|nr:hypothetical protein CRG98_040543 [Punica granatum]